MKTPIGNKLTFYPSSKYYSEFINIQFNSSFWGGEEKKNGRAIYKWCGTDSNKFFEHNLKTKEAKLLQPYVDTPVTYDVNRQKFRTSYEIDKPIKDKVIVTLGCSMTFGVGMYNNLIWPSIIEQSTEYKVLNLGLPGMGVEHSYIALSRAIEEGWKIDKVLHFHPIFGRYVSLSDNKDGTFINVIAANSDYEDNAKFVYKWEYWRDWVTKEGHIFYDHKRAIDAITGVCMTNDINYYYINSQPYSRYYKRKNYDLDKLDSIPTKMIMETAKGDQIARDLIHPSKFQHRTIANSFINLMNKHDYYLEPLTISNPPDNTPSEFKRLF